MTGLDQMSNHSIVTWKLQLYIKKTEYFDHFWHFKQNSDLCNFIKITSVQVLFLYYRNNNNQAMFWVPSMGNTDASLPDCKCLQHKQSKFVQSDMFIKKGNCRCSELNSAVN